MENINKIYILLWPAFELDTELRLTIYKLTSTVRLIYEQLLQSQVAFIQMIMIFLELYANLTHHIYTKESLGYAETLNEKIK